MGGLSNAELPEMQEAVEEKEGHGEDDPLQMRPLQS
jgi:hypothetical protein